MYVSGSLKNKTINFYREKMVDFDDASFQTDDVCIGFNGEISCSPLSDGDIERKLNVRQERLIRQGIDNTYKLAKRKYIPTHLVEKEIDILRRTPRSVSYALFECFYTLIINAKDVKDLELKIQNFEYLRSTVVMDANLSRLSQVNLDVMIKLFLEGEPYFSGSIMNRKQSMFGIKEAIYKGAHSEEIWRLIHLGEFMAPTRVRNLAPKLENEIEPVKYIAPIYFGLASDEAAEQFFNLCNRIDIDREDVIKYASRVRAPENLINLAKR